MKQTDRIEWIIERFAVLGLGYLFFIVIFSHISFLFNQALSKSTLLISFLLYLIISYPLLYRGVQSGRKSKTDHLIAFSLFVVFAVSMFLIGKVYFSKTYDTSWDGQGYHSSGILSLAGGWNPIYEKDLPIQLPDASIIVKGYPKALWIIQGNLYLAAGSFNAGKVTNLAVLLIAAAFSYCFLRRLKIRFWASFILSGLIVLQPPFLMEFFTFMADGFSYQLAIIALASLGMLALDKTFGPGLVAFLAAELLLVGAKYSNWPLVGILGLVFLAIIFKKITRSWLVLPKKYILFLAAGIIFLISPYATNQIFYGHIFYPSNLKEIKASYGQDNIPQNLKDANRAKLLFYSTFSASQLRAMGKDDPMNQASLKIPFTFSREELEKSATIFNNRVGAVGPLFSGVFVLALLTMVVLFRQWPKINSDEKKILLVVSGMITIFIAVSLISPVPNLIRYNYQIVIIPFIIIVATLGWFQKSYLAKTAAYLTIFCLMINTALYSNEVLGARQKEFASIDEQLQAMRHSSGGFEVKTPKFYSNNVRLEENAVVSYPVEELKCKNPEFLANSHFTTRFCPK